MPINELAINSLLDMAVKSDSSDRVYFVEGGNLMTAIEFFTRITGQRLTRTDLSMRASGGFFVRTYQDAVLPINVMVRGGSSSDVSYTRMVHILSHDHQLVDASESSQVAHGVPTLDITSPGSLLAVPRIVNAVGRVEFKFTTRFQYETTKY